MRIPINIQRQWYIRANTPTGQSLPNATPRMKLYHSRAAFHPKTEAKNWIRTQVQGLPGHGPQRLPRIGHAIYNPYVGHSAPKVFDVEANRLIRGDEWSVVRPR